MRTENRGITHEDAIDEIYNILDKYGVSDSDHSCIQDVLYDLEESAYYAGQDNINSMRGGGRIAGQRY